MAVDREELLKQMKLLKSKSRKAKAEGKRQAALAFRAGAARLQRRIRGLAKVASDQAAAQG